MNCKNCGLPLKEGAEVCENCGTPADTAEMTAQTAEAVHIPDEQPVEIPVQEEEEAPQIALNTAAEPPKKKWGLKAILIGAGALLLVLAVIVTLNFGSITRWFLLNFGSADEIFQTVQQQNIDTAVTAFGEVYKTVYESSGPQMTHTRTDMRIKLGKLVMSGVEGMTDANGQPIDMSWLENILVQVDANYRSEGYQVNMGIGFGEQIVLTMDVLMDSATGKQYLAIPELNETYLYMISEADSAATMSMLLPGYLPEPAVMKESLARYMGIPLKHVCDVKRSEETLTVDKLEKEAVVLTARMHEKAAIEMVIEVLQTAREDQALKALVDTVGQAQAASDPAFTEEDYYSQFQQEIDSALTECQAQLETAATDEYLSWNLYLDAKTGAMLGQRLISPEGEVEIEAIVLTEKEDIVGRIATSELELLLDATLEDGIFDGEATLSAEGEEALKIGFEDYDLLKGNGTVGMQFGEAALGADMSMAALRLEFEMEDGQTGDMKILVGGIVFATVTFEQTVLDSEPITFPTDALNADDQFAGYTWMAGMKYDTLLNNLKLAGVPESFIQYLVQLFAGSLDTGVLY